MFLKNTHELTHHSGAFIFKYKHTDWPMIDAWYLGSFLFFSKSCLVSIKIFTFILKSEITEMIERRAWWFSNDEWAIFCFCLFEPQQWALRALFSLLKLVSEEKMVLDTVPEKTTSQLWPGQYENLRMIPVRKCVGFQRKTNDRMFKIFIMCRSSTNSCLIAETWFRKIALFQGCRLYAILERFQPRDFLVVNHQLILANKSPAVWLRSK